MAAQHTTLIAMTTGTKEGELDIFVWLPKNPEYLAFLISSNIFFRFCENVCRLCCLFKSMDERSKLNY
jgi:hypothetical protein